MCKLDLPLPELGAIYRRCVGSGPDRWHSSSWWLVVLFSADIFALCCWMLLAFCCCGMRDRAFPLIIYSCSRDWTLDIQATTDTCRRTTKQQRWTFEESQRRNCQSRLSQTGQPGTGQPGATKLTLYRLAS